MHTHKAETGGIISNRLKEVEEYLKDAIMAFAPKGVQYNYSDSAQDLT